MPHKDKDKKNNKESDHENSHKHKHKHRSDDSIVYAEFIRPFTFGLPQEPIVESHGSVVFPIPTVEPQGVRYIDEKNRVGLLVPRGTYLVSFTLFPSQDAHVDLLVNGVEPKTPTGLSYAKFRTTTVLDVQVLVEAPLRRDNLISLFNSGDKLFTLSDIPNTKIDSTSLLTRISVQRLKK